MTKPLATDGNKLKVGIAVIGACAIAGYLVSAKSKGAPLVAPQFAAVLGAIAGILLAPIATSKFLAEGKKEV